MFKTLLTILFLIPTLAFAAPTVPAQGSIPTWNGTTYVASTTIMVGTVTATSTTATSTFNGNSVIGNLNVLNTGNVSAGAYPNKLTPPNVALQVPRIDWTLASTSASAASYGQGWAYDGTYFYLTSNNLTDKFDDNWNLIATNNNVLGGLSGVNHQGDPDVYNGVIYTPIETYNGCTISAAGTHDMNLARYNASDLSLIGTTSLVAQGNEVSSVAVAPDLGVLFISSFCDTTIMPMYNLNTLAFIGYLKLSSPINTIQGIKYKNGILYVSSWGDEKIYAVNPKTGAVSTAYNILQTGEVEGIDFLNDWLGLLIAGDKIYFSTPIVAASTTLSVSTGGNVGIGTSTPAYPFEVWGSGTGAPTSGDFIVDSNNKTVTVGRLSGIAGDTTQFTVRDRLGQAIISAVGGSAGNVTIGPVGTAGNLIFQTDGSGSILEVARFNPSGRFGIGTSTPDKPLVVSQSTVSDTEMVIESLFNSGDSSGAKLVFRTPYAGALNEGSIRSSFWQSPGMTFTTPRDINGWGYAFNSKAGSRLMYINSTDGNVGIGTSTPTGRLDVKSTSQFQVGDGIEITRATGNPYYDMKDDINKDYDFRMQFVGTDPYNALIFSASSTANMVVFKSTGSVGIGESSPGSKLSVSGSGSFGSSYDTSAAPANGLLIEGSVGIGTTTPTSKLQVADNAAAVNVASSSVIGIMQQNSSESAFLYGVYDYSKPSFGITFNRQYTANRYSTLGGIYVYGSSGWQGGLLFNTKQNTSQFGTPDTTAMMMTPPGDIIIPTGTLRIGTTTSMSVGQKFEVDGGNNSGKIGFGLADPDSTIRMYRWSGAPGLYYPWYLATGRGSDGADFAIRTNSTGIVAPGTEASMSDRLIIRATGNVGIGTSTPFTRLHVSSGASATTTVTIGEIGLTTSKGCVNINRADGGAGSFYLNAAGALVSEANYCK